MASFYHEGGLFLDSFVLNRAVPFAIHNTAPTQAECDRAASLYQSLLADPASFPCSFRLDGQPYQGFGPEFTHLSRRRHPENRSCSGLTHAFLPFALPSDILLPNYTREDPIS